MKMTRASRKHCSWSIPAFVLCQRLDPVPLNCNGTRDGSYAWTTAQTAQRTAAVHRSIRAAIRTEQRSEHSRAQSTANKEQRTKNREQRTENREQSCELRAEQRVVRERGPSHSGKTISASAVWAMRIVEVWHVLAVHSTWEKQIFSESTENQNKEMGK